jgi:predicted nucleic acid-binding protein
MTIQVELKPEMAARLKAEAHAQGISLERAAERLLQEALALRAVDTRSLTVEEFRAMLQALARDSDALPNLPTESFTRESFYQDRP